MSKSGKIAKSQPDTDLNLDGEIITFEGLLAEEESLETQHKEVRERIQKEWDETQARIWKEKRGKRKYPGQVIACQEIPELADAYLELQDVIREMLRIQTQEGAKVLKRIMAYAEDLPVPLTHGKTRLEWARVSSSTYRSQGYGAMKYARQSAESRADKARIQGLTPVIEEVDFSPAKGINGISHADYKIMVNTTDTGLVLLKYKPDQSLRDWVKACWGRGCQPRVILPELPHVYEEENGLDYF